MTNNFVNISPANNVTVLKFIYLYPDVKFSFARNWERVKTFLEWTFEIENGRKYTCIYGFDSSHYRFARDIYSREHVQ
jgi:hypothetical protein